MRVTCPADFLVVCWYVKLGILSLYLWYLWLNTGSVEVLLYSWPKTRMRSSKTRSVLSGSRT